MAERITVVTENRNLRTLPFTPSEDHLTTGSQWEEWLEGIEREFRYFRITEPEDKKDAMIIYGGKEISRLEKSTPDPVDRRMDVYEKLKKKLNDYFAPKKNKHYARYVFLKMRPINGESTVAYATRLRERAADCEFENQDDRILEHIIQTTDNESLIKKTINRKWTLDQMLQEVHQLEDTTLQIHDMRDIYTASRTGEIAKVTNYGGKQRHYGMQNREETYTMRHERRNNCNYCGKTHSFEQREDCGAYGKQCNKCHKWNHFAVVCKSSMQSVYQDNDQFRNQRYTERNQGRNVRRTMEDTDEEEYSDDEFFGRTVNHLGAVKKINVHKIGNEARTVLVMMNDVEVKIEPDSGADVNVMDEYQYRAYKNRTREGAELLESKTKLSTLQSSLKVKGEFITTVRNATRGIKTKVIVIKGKTNSPPLIGKKTLIELGMLQIQEDGTLKEPNGLGIRGGNAKFEHKIPEIRNKAARTKSNHIRKSNKTENIIKKITQRDKNTRAQGDKEYKQNVTNKHSQKKKYREHSFKISDRVSFKQEKRNKWSTAYELEPYIIYKISGSSIGAQRKSDGRKVFRDSSHFKLENNIDIPNSNGKWRDRIWMHTKPNGDKHMVAPGR
ncbi:unnamed protein product [Mytilus edulis]|uniref:Uncharacterized protein n=1 Tax=Mytilus edulis TaxID=6550 RepID=A0A8S3TRE9_MYTED|nr:unnamed protein product [Mytilus edulis]